MSSSKETTWKITDNQSREWSRTRLL